MILRIKDYHKLYSKARTFKNLVYAQWWVLSLAYHLELNFKISKLCSILRLEAIHFAQWSLFTWRIGTFLKCCGFLSLCVIFKQSVDSGLGMKSCNSCLVTHVLWPRGNALPSCSAAASSSTVDKWYLTRFNDNIGKSLKYIHQFENEGGVIVLFM